MNINNEIWLPVRGYEGMYDVSSIGRIRSHLPVRNLAKPPDEPRIVKTSKDRDGYARLSLYGKGRPRYARVPVLVCEAFHGCMPSKDSVVRHLDGNRSHDYAWNLSWGTAKENSEDAKRHGTRVNGEKVNTAKLTKDDVLKIRNSNQTCVALAKIYPVNESMISKIKNKECWKHV